jgi:hypothetical protein
VKKYLLAVLIAGIAIVFWYYSPKNIDKTLNGFLYQLGEAENGGMVDIQIQGKQHYTLTGERIFKGTIEIEGQSISAPGQSEELELTFETGNSAQVSYVFFSNASGASNPVIINFGQIHAGKSFSRLTIRQFNEDGVWTGSDGLMIPAPAENWKDAIRISDDLIEEYQLNGNVFVEAKTE